MLINFIIQFNQHIHFIITFGSGPLWQRHLEMLRQMEETINQVQTNLTTTDEMDQTSQLSFDCLPVEMQREVIKRLDNGTDIVNVGMINSNFYRVSQELLIWRQLCHYHFGGDTETNSNSILGEKILGLMRRQEKNLDLNNLDWKMAYFKLKRQYGLREVYAEMIHQCQLCKCLYWQVCSLLVKR